MAFLLMSPSNITLMTNPWIWHMRTIPWGCIHRSGMYSGSHSGRGLRMLWGLRVLWGLETVWGQGGMGAQVLPVQRLRLHAPAHNMQLSLDTQRMRQTQEYTLLANAIGSHYNQRVRTNSRSTRCKPCRGSALCEGSSWARTSRAWSSHTADNTTAAAVAAARGLRASLLWCCQFCSACC